MGSRSLERWMLKEILIWISAFAAGYITFLSFEPLYESVKRAATRAGFAHIFEFDTNGPGQPAWKTKLSSSFSLPLRGTLPAGQTGTSPRRVILSANAYGHFNTQAEISGQEIEFMTDTGATYVALTYESALKLGLASANLRFTGRSTTANGVAHVASVILDTVRIGEITVRNVQAVVAEPGRMSQNLLGMSFIGRLSGFELAGSKLVMTE